MKKERKANSANLSEAPDPSMSSWFGGGGAPSVPQPSHLDLVRTELELMADMFNRMVGLCFQKCVDSRAYKDGELDVDVGEMSCTDRCAGKYLEASIRVGERLQKLEQQHQAAGPQGDKMAHHNGFYQHGRAEEAKGASIFRALAPR